MLQPGYTSLQDRPRARLLRRLGSFLLFAGLALNVWMLLTGAAVALRLSMLVMAPGVILLFSAFLAENTPSMRGCLSVVAVLLAFMAGFWAWVGVTVSLGTEPVIDPEAYRPTMARAGVSKSDHLAHFPTRIPEEAENVSFYYLPSVMESAEIFELRMALPPERVEEIISEASDDLAEVAPETAAALHAGPSSEDMAGFPVHRAHLPEKQQAPAWGIAANPETGDIIYWAMSRTAGEQSGAEM